MEYEQKGILYEYFIRKVFKCQRTNRRGADRKFMIRVYLNETDEFDSKPKIRKQYEFNRVHSYVHAAISKCARKKTFLRSEHQFDEIRVKMGNSTTPDDLMEVVSLMLKKISVLEKEYKEYREQKKLLEGQKYKNRSA